MAKTILIIDDDPIIVKYLENLFNDNGYETLIAHDGPEARDILKGTKPDLITLDLEMPEEWGPRFFRKMIQNEALKDIPVIVISGISDPKRSIRKAVAIIRKPFDADKLLGIVRRTIG
ncbi:DVU0259 family response regulator domain-containing protein [Thermodesulfobacteriota bacterium]